ncbi:hypothetical protein CUN91_00170 [Candidatus Carsonella ruddii]|uniref:Uncharacterized protein n=1 Tax=Carsonella ruddii TaxID=114186 RepID=A0A2K8K439_CARRU|nr:hypothetical protein [Candidatus Carsonella ruddii]ATX33372.1 hypothetical protein CUN91_00170 [Candidatus Carsonella ruddii]
MKLITNCYFNKKYFIFKIFNTKKCFLIINFNFKYFIPNNYIVFKKKIIIRFPLLKKNFSIYEIF